jgi:phosphoribosyl-ATP pyrophosphohydrolase
MSDTPRTRIDLGWLWDVLESRRAEGDAENSYTARLIAAGQDRVAQKVGEEATETIIAGLGLRVGGEPGELVGEAADLVYHLLVFLMVCGVTPADVLAELERRHRDVPPEVSPSHAGEEPS